jgi:putative membrane protein insertion efficiency factor
VTDRPIDTPGEDMRNPTGWLTTVLMGSTGPGSPGSPPGPGPGWGRTLFPGDECCAGPGCCLIGLSSPLLLAAIPARLARAHRTTCRNPDSHRPEGTGPDGRTARLLHRGVRFYQAELSPLTAPHCPHTPTCSQYASQALSRHGAARGSWLTARRLLRCRPGTAGGPDPVP